MVPSVPTTVADGQDSAVRRARSSTFRILPEAVIGNSSTNFQVRGTLNDARCSRQ